MEEGNLVSAWFGKQVIVRLNSNVDYRGVLISLDGYMNVALEGAEELLAGASKQKYGDVFIRGNNGSLDS